MFDGCLCLSVVAGVSSDKRKSFDICGSEDAVHFAAVDQEKINNLYGLVSLGLLPALSCLESGIVPRDDSIPLTMTDTKHQSND